MTVDNWSDLSTYCCETCRFFVPKLSPPIVKDHPDDKESYLPGKVWKTEKLKQIGRCRRKAPTLDGWPVVYSDDWCGDHKLGEI